MPPFLPFLRWVYGLLQSVQSICGRFAVDLRWVYGQLLFRRMTESLIISMSEIYTHCGSIGAMCFIRWYKSSKSASDMVSIGCEIVVSAGDICFKIGMLS